MKKRLRKKLKIKEFYYLRPMIDPKIIALTLKYPNWLKDIYDSILPAEDLNLSRLFCVRE